MIHRILESKLKQMKSRFPVISITGPRQSGKTTLAKVAFPKSHYSSLEDPSERSLFERDPEFYLERFSKLGILDEVQREPEIFSWIQGLVDKNEKQKFILTGSQNFLLLHRISQTLAGRVYVMKLLPLSISELDQAGMLPASVNEVMFRGFYPRIYNKKIHPQDFYPSYVQSYIERDVRQITNVGDLSTFSNFLKICAGRAGQLLNLSQISNESGVSVNTVKSWISILEASYIVFLLPPFYRNFSKRLVKMPKLYFYDTGILCYLLGLRNAADLQNHFARGAVFENMVIADVMKQYFNAGKVPNLFFWHDHSGREIDLIVEDGTKLIPFEIKSGVTKSLKYFDQFPFWCSLTGQSPAETTVIYNGKDDIKSPDGNLLTWKTFCLRKIS